MLYHLLIKSEQLTFGPHIQINSARLCSNHVKTVFTFHNSLKFQKQELSNILNDFS
jgi:hypothetical protein